MDQKYIELLLNGCLKLNKDKPLFLSYDASIKEFAIQIVNYAKKMGIKDIYPEQKDQYEEARILNDCSINDIEYIPYFKREKWDEYAAKDSAFLFIETVIPHVLDGIDEEKVAKASTVKRISSPLYREKQMKNIIPWCIAAYPNEKWAKFLFPDEENALEKMKKYFYELCLVDENNPIHNWEKLLENNKSKLQLLNKLKFKTLHYINSLGTDLEVGLTKDCIWCDAGGEYLVNMPSYEIFTSPNYKKTNGIVYSSRPLINNSSTIDEFWLRFKDGKVVDFDAKKGKKLLEGIINSDSNSCYLGECALIDKDTPIAKSNIVYHTTLFDENASCHLALGEGFSECISKAVQDSKDLLDNDINYSKTHVDFMIGTDDMDIIGETYDNDKYYIMKQGKIIIKKI